VEALDYALVIGARSQLSPHKAEFGCWLRPRLTLLILSEFWSVASDYAPLAHSAASRRGFGQMLDFERNLRGSRPCIDTWTRSDSQQFEWRSDCCGIEPTSADWWLMWAMSPLVR